MQMQRTRAAVTALSWLLLVMAVTAALASLGMLSLLPMVPAAKLVVTLAVSAIYALTAVLLFELRKIVGSVGIDPFTRTNARRLLRMGWLAAAWQACELALAFSGQNVNLVSVAGLRLRTVEPETVSIASLLLILILFALAHVFNRGAEMREELEGTV